MGPWASSAAAIAASRLSPSVTSAATVRAPSGPPSPDLLVTATWSPRRRNSSAIERPIPRLPPVIRTLRGCGVLSDIVDSLVDGAVHGARRMAGIASACDHVSALRYGARRCRDPRGETRPGTSLLGRCNQMAYRFNPPPNWPIDDPAWSPPPGWQPDPSWGPAPEGWNFWVHADAPAESAAPEPTEPGPEPTSAVEAAPDVEPEPIAEAEADPEAEPEQVAEAEADPDVEHPVPVVTDDDETRVVSTGPQHHDPAVEPEEDQAADEDATRIVPSRAQTPVAGDEPTATSSPERDEARAADTAEYPGPDLQADLAQQAPYETAQPAEPGAQQPAQGQPPAAPSPFETAAVEPEVGQPATSPGQPAPTQGYGEPAPGQGYDQASSDHGQGSPAYGPAAPAHGQRPPAHGQASPDYGPASPTYGQAPSYGQVSPAPSYGAPSPSPGYGQAPASPAPWSPAQGSPGMDSAVGSTASTGRAAETPQKGLVARFWWVGCIVLFLGAVLFAALIVLIILLSDGQGQAHGADPAAPRTSVVAEETTDTHTWDTPA